MDPIIKKAYEATLKNQSYAFATIIEATAKGTPRKAGAKMVVFADGQIWGTVGGGRNEKAVIEACREAIKSGEPILKTYNYFGREGESVCGGQVKVFIEPFAGKRHLVICGAGHIALPLSIITKMLNFKVTIIDSRIEFANKKRFPHVDKIILGNHAEMLAEVDIDKNTYIMIVTHGNEFDFECLRAVINSRAGYIGVISSMAKRIKFFRRLKDLKITNKSLKQIRIPSGLDIGAQTPEEIAISISAEIVMEYNHPHLGSTKFRAKL